MSLSHRGYESRGSWLGSLTGTASAAALDAFYQPPRPHVSVSNDRSCVVQDAFRRNGRTLAARLSTRSRAGSAGS